jgi:glutaredoxin
MKRSLQLASLLLLCAASAHAQLYKWVGPDGKISYSDTPPPSSATQVETKTLTTNAANTADFPYELAQAAKSSPVTLYTTAKCAPCDDGRKLLGTRGVPFAEKTVNSGDDISKFHQFAGTDARLPVLTVGRNMQRGFEAGAWNTALSAAGYPENSVLPKSYRNLPAEALAPVAKPVIAKQDKRASGSDSPGQSSSGELPPAIGNAPPGFRF